MAAPVKNLWLVLRKHKSQLRSPIVPYKFNPFEVSTPAHVLVFQGPNNTGKTTLFATSIPWFRRFGPLAYTGIILNGNAGKTVDTFREWHTSQLFGQTTSGGSELEKCIQDYQQRQWLRSFLADLGLPIEPKPAWIIVDQFEELLRKYPDQALGWADHLTDIQARDGLARVFFVVNSDAGARSILNLNRGNRFDHYVLDLPTADAVTGIPDLDLERLTICNFNIGLCKDEAGVSTPDLPAIVAHRQGKWKENYHVPFPVKYDDSWHLQPFDETLLCALRVRLEALGKYTPEKIDARVAWASATIEGASPAILRDMSWEGWRVWLHAEGANNADAEKLATAVKHTLAVPVPKECLPGARSDASAT
jgi:hypothetical protein